MRIRWVIAILLGVIVLGCRTGRDSESLRDERQTHGRREDSLVKTDAELVESLTRVIEELVGKDEFSGVVRLSRNERALLRGAYGYADRERGRLNTVETPFALASVSKMFTAVLIAQMAE